MYDESPDYQALLYRLIDEAMAHTSNPKEGDYLRGNYLGLYNTSRIQIIPTGNGYNYIFTLNFIFTTTAEQELQVDAAVDSVLESLQLAGKTDYQKIRAVYDYICSHVVYDYAHLNDPDYSLQYSAYAALINGTSVCQGYATLFYRFMMELGIDCRLITGIGVSGEDMGPHAWNIVAINGLYYNLDATWDAGCRKYSWFLRGPWTFPDHYRNSDYETLEFHTAYPMSAEDYDPDAPGQADPVCCSGVCGENVTWVLLNSGELIISGTGATYDYGSTEQAAAPWAQYAQMITEVRVEEGITQIGDHLFAALPNLTAVTLPESLQEIGSYAFRDCTSLEGVTVPQGTIRIEEQAFACCTALTTISLPDTLTDIGSGAFLGCRQLTAVCIPEGVTAIEPETFNGCFSLQTVTLPDTLTSIGAYAFASCVKLSEILLPGTLVSIGDHAFSSCSALATVTLPEQVAYVGGCAFAYCSNLETVYFLGDAPEFSGNIFLYDNVTAYYPGNNPTWTGDAYAGTGDRVTWLPAACPHETVSVTTAPTCTEQGYTTTTCTLCGDVTITDYVDALGHTPGEIQVENEVSATCTAAGGYDNVTYCTVCDAELSRDTVVVDMLPHAPGETQLENVIPPTCAATGSYDNVIFCTACSAELSRETVTVNPIPHTCVSEVIQPTCTEGGYTAYACIFCDHSYTAAPTDPLGHHYEEGHCSRCGRPEHYLGDVNGDDVVDTLDAYYILLYYREKITLTELQLTLADVDGNGQVDAADAYWITLYVSGRITAFPKQ